VADLGDGNVRFILSQRETKDIGAVIYQLSDLKRVLEEQAKKRSVETK
jgi:hypothetical protein